ncbi:hypothetical protein WCLP8_530007 [uncultured Gammaproteobacteria bacterium]
MRGAIRPLGRRHSRQRRFGPPDEVEMYLVLFVILVIVLMLLTNKPPAPH